MKFCIFHKTGELRFDKNEYDEGIIDEGCDIDIEVPDDQVRFDLAECVYIDYISGVIPKSIRQELDETAIINRIALLISDFELDDMFLGEWGDELHDMYEDDYNDGE